MEEAGNMVDLHNHILSGQDDGAETLEESIQMCRIGYRDGIRTVVATPHILPEIYENDRSTILSGVVELNNALSQCGLQLREPSGSERMENSPSLDSSIRNPWPVQCGANFTGPQSALKILPGADVHFSSDLLERLKRKEILTVNDQGRYLMIEFSSQGIPYLAEETLFQLISSGIIPIISHPERNAEIIRKPQRYYQMIRMGCLGQVTAMSLTGGFGLKAKRTAEKLLTKRWLHFIASDAHSVDGRPPILSAGVKAAEKIVGKEEARKMVTEYPEAIIEGRKPDVPEPISI